VLAYKLKPGSREQAFLDFSFMKHFLLLIIGFAFSIAGNCIEFKGYIVTNQGDTIHGYFFYEKLSERGFKYRSMYYQCIFMAEKNPGKIYLRPMEIKEYYFYEPDFKKYYHFVSYEVMINSSWLPQLTKLFLRQEATGKLSLF
jgi:hypothetical protein